MSLQGKIREWNDDRGFGFIESEDAGKRVFVHIKSFVRRSKRPLVNDLVTYRISPDERGRLQAHNVSFSLKPAQFNNYFLKNLSSLLLVVLFFIFLAVLVVFGMIPFMVLGYFIIISGLTFFAYFMDKSAAQDGEWRLPEDTLHVLSIFGGWAGALTAQVLIRHKSKKTSFKRVFWVTVALNMLLFCFLFTENGSIFLTDISSLI